MKDFKDVNVHLLDKLNDIDTFDDLRPHQELLKHMKNG